MAQKTQCHPKWRVTSALIGGPMKAGITQQTLNQVMIVARADSSKTVPITTIRHRFIAPPPRPCRKRAATSTSIEGAAPATKSPARKSAPPPTSGFTGPIRSARRPATTVAKVMPRTKRVNTQA